MAENLIGVTENGQVKGMPRWRRLIPFYTIQQGMPNNFTKLQNPRRSSSSEIFGATFPMYYIGMSDGKKEE